jgi:L-asparaginase
MRIKVFTTGGSIDKQYVTSSSTFEVGEPQAAAILQEAIVTLGYEVESLLRKDSLEFTPIDREQIVNKVRAEHGSHILITHGTDTMVETAQALHDISGKVIVLTGAMQPAAFRSTDAHFNLGGAIIALQTLPEGVYIVMNGKVFDPFHASKNRTLERFEETG